MSITEPEADVYRTVSTPASFPGIPGSNRSSEAGNPESCFMVPLSFFGRTLG